MSRTFHIPPADQGQIIQVAWAADWEHGEIIKRITDTSIAPGEPFRVTEVRIRADLLTGGWEPWNTRPRFTNDL